MRHTRHERPVPLPSLTLSVWYDDDMSEQGSPSGSNGGRSVSRPLLENEVRGPRGGILLFFVAFEMLNGEMTKTRLGAEDRADALARRDEISIVPLGIPLLAGPGAISTVMIYIGSAGTNVFDILSVFVAIGVTTAASYVILRYGHGILRRLGRVGAMAITVSLAASSRLSLTVTVSLRIRRSRSWM